MVLASVLLYVLTTRVERERRPPAIAIAWVLGMIALPYVALPMYILFGRRKMPRRTIRWSGVRTAAHHWAEELIESFGLPGAAPSLTEMHQDGRESAAALFRTFDEAKKRLDVCTYILGDDVFGRDAMQRLMACARRGVQVRLLLDGVGALQLPRACFKQMEAAGVETAIFSALFARKTQGPRNLRNHRKMVIADGERLWAGGRNIAAEYFSGADGVAPWRDLTFTLRGAPTHAAAAQFEADWVAAGGKPVSQDSVEMAAADIIAPLLKNAEVQSSDATPTATPAPAARGRAQFLPSGPDQTEDTVHALLIDALLSSSRAHARGDALLRAGCELGNRHALGRTARRANRFGHPQGIQPSSRGLRTQPLAAGIESGRRQRAPVAHYEPRQSGGFR